MSLTLIDGIFRALQALSADFPLPSIRPRASFALYVRFIGELNHAGAFCAPAELIRE
jgi:hypothetical protein